VFLLLLFDVLVVDSASKLCSDRDDSTFQSIKSLCVIFRRKFAEFIPDTLEAVEMANSTKNHRSIADYKIYFWYFEFF
jgi:hypothetical protein